MEDPLHLLNTADLLIHFLGDAFVTTKVCSDLTDANVVTVMSQQN